MKTFTITIHVLMIRDDRAWVAQGLQHDIAAQGDTIEEALERFKRVLASEARFDLRNGQEPLAEVPPAPQSLWDIWATSEPLKRDLGPVQMSSPNDMPPAWMINVFGPEIRIHC